MGSDLVLSDCNSFARVFKVLCESMTYNIIHGMLEMSVKVTESGQKWPFWCGSGAATKDLKQAQERSECDRESPAGA